MSKQFLFLIIISYEMSALKCVFGHYFLNTGFEKKKKTLIALQFLIMELWPLISKFLTNGILHSTNVLCR